MASSTGVLATSSLAAPLRALAAPASKAAVPPRAPCINHSKITGDVNLIQVAGYVKQDSKNGGRHAEDACKALGMQERRSRIDGVGRDVIVGTYGDAIRVAEHLGASDAALAAVKDALEGIVSPEDSDEAPLDVSLFPTRDNLLVIKGNKEDPFPVKMNREVAAWLEFGYYKNALKRVRDVADAGDISWGTDVIEETLGTNLVTGRAIKIYAFTWDGFKAFCMLSPSKKGNLVRRYFLEVEREVHKVIPSETAQSIVKTAWIASEEFIKRKETIYGTKMMESTIRDRFAKFQGGATEVSCKHGRVDILTDTHVIEVKRVQSYKSAIGQAIVYKQCFPGKRAQIHLFGSEKYMKLFKRARKACKGLDIDVSVEFVESSGTI